MDKKDEIISKAMGAAKKATATLTGYTGIFSTLQKEHGEVAALMKRVQATGSDDVDDRRSLFAKIRTELLAHAHAEQETFYDRLAERPETVDLVTEAKREHEELEAILDELSDLDVSSEQFDDRFEELVSETEHHVAEEENELFPKAKDALTSEEISQLDDAFKARKSVELERVRVDYGQQTGAGRVLD